MAGGVLYTEGVLPSKAGVSRSVRLTLVCATTTRPQRRRCCVPYKLPDATPAALPGSARLYPRVGHRSGPPWALRKNAFGVPDLTPNT